MGEIAAGQGDTLPGGGRECLFSCPQAARAASGEGQEKKRNIVGENGREGLTMTCS